MKLTIFLLFLFSTLVSANRLVKRIFLQIYNVHVDSSEESYEDSIVSSEEYESNVYDDLNIDPEEALEFLNKNDYVDNDDIHYEGRL